MLSSKSINKRLQRCDWWKNFLNQPVKSDVRTYDSIHKFATGQGDDYTTDCLLDYNHFNKHYKMTVIESQKTTKVLWMLSFDLATACSTILFFVI